MVKLSRDSWQVIVVLVMLVAVTIAAAIYRARGQQETAPPLSSFSTAPNGARALWLWLEELDYPVSNESGATFSVPGDISVALVLEPLALIAEGEWQVLDAWVEDGGTLVLAGESGGMALATRHYDFSLAYLGDQVITLTAQTPLLASPPLTGTLQMRIGAYFTSERDDFVTLLAVEQKPVMVTFEQGDGRVILCATPYPFSNAGLKEAGNPALVANVIAAAAHPGPIWFDEWHHGLRTRTGVVGPEEWLRYTPSGHALLYTAAVIFFALLLSGRRFGRPVPLPRQVVRRAPLEYITAIANLNRRAGHRAMVLADYRQRLKRDLGKRYRLNPALPDDEFVTRLAGYNPNLDENALRELLARLRQARVSESEMLQLATQVARLLDTDHADFRR